MAKEYVTISSVDELKGIASGGYQYKFESTSTYIMWYERQLSDREVRIMMSICSMLGAEGVFVALVHGIKRPDSIYDLAPKPEAAEHIARRFLDDQE